MIKHTNITAEKYYKVVKAFCLGCGELNVNAQGEVEHPEQDKILADTLKNSFNTIYTRI